MQSYLSEILTSRHKSPIFDMSFILIPTNLCIGRQRWPLCGEGLLMGFPSYSLTTFDPKYKSESLDRNIYNG